MTGRRRKPVWPITPGTDSMMTSQLMRKLESRGLLERVVDPGDARARRLVLTEAGRRLTTTALADVERADLDYFTALGAGRAGFLRALQILDGG